MYHIQRRRGKRTLVVVLIGIHSLKDLMSLKKGEAELRTGLKEEIRSEERLAIKDEETFKKRA
jgi:hypothetical protein